MEEAVRTALAQTKSRLVILEGDREAFLGSAVTVMDVARKAGAEKFAIATSPEK
jgi:biopolymer transport protein ExbD